MITTGVHDSMVATCAVDQVSTFTVNEYNILGEVVTVNASSQDGPLIQLTDTPHAAP